MSRRTPRYSPYSRPGRQARPGGRSLYEQARRQGFQSRWGDVGVDRKSLTQYTPRLRCAEATSVMEGLMYLRESKLQPTSHIIARLSHPMTPSRYLNAYEAEGAPRDAATPGQYQADYNTVMAPNVGDQLGKPSRYTGGGGSV